MAKNHSFLGLLCIVALCLHLHFACHSLKPESDSRPGFESTNSLNHQSGKLIKDNADMLRLNAQQSKRTQQLSPKQLQVQKIYTGQIGVKEKGHNAGKQVEAYLAYVGLGKGHAWCAAFICWVYGQANVPNPKTPWTPSLFPANKTIWKKGESTLLSINSAAMKHPAKAIHRSAKNTEPQTGDIFGLYFPEKKRIAHAGFIDQWGENWVITVEGNTNADGHREGDGVYRKKRLKKSIYRVARYF